MTTSLLIVGRGPSAARFDFRSWRGDIMAVSSGIFVDRMPAPQHFVTVDEPKYFMGALWPDSAHAWSNDPICTPWRFWARAEIAKHVPLASVRGGHYRLVPPALLAAAPERHRATLRAALNSASHEMGFQPGWGDYSNVQGWQLDRRAPMSFEPCGTFGLDGVGNSLLFALQVAARLGYRRHVLVGVDLTEARFAQAVEVLRHRSADAAAHGIEWLIGAGGEGLRFMPALEVAA